jgi:Uri superfamily endonuclease
MSAALRGAKRSKKMEAYLGCSMDALRDHFESLFTEGMGWHNRDQWHIDHILPVSIFDHTKEDEIAKCWHYSNLRPLWAYLNLKKHAKLNTGI